MARLGNGCEIVDAEILLIRNACKQDSEQKAIGHRWDFVCK